MLEFWEDELEYWTELRKWLKIHSMDTTTADESIERSERMIFINKRHDKELSLSQ